eukprot:8383627-Alexandrium_andersonii.AAC.1
MPPRATQWPRPISAPVGPSARVWPIAILICLYHRLAAVSVEYNRVRGERVACHLADLQLPDLPMMPPILSFGSADAPDGSDSDEDLGHMLAVVREVSGQPPADSDSDLGAMLDLAQEAQRE